MKKLGLKPGGLASKSELLNFCYIASSVAGWLMDHATLQLKFPQPTYDIKYKLIQTLHNPALSDTSSSIYHCRLTYIVWYTACFIFSVPKIQFLSQAAICSFSPRVILLFLHLGKQSPLWLGLRNHAPKGYLPGACLLFNSRGLSEGERNNMNKDEEVSFTLVLYPSP